MRVAAFLLLGKVFGAFKEMAVLGATASATWSMLSVYAGVASWLPVTIVGALSGANSGAVQVRKTARPARARFLGDCCMVLLGGLALAVVLYVVWPGVALGRRRITGARAGMSSHLMLACPSRVADMLTV